MRSRVLGPQACIWSSHVPLQIRFLLGQVGLPEPSSLRCEEHLKCYSSDDPREGRSPGCGTWRVDKQERQPPAHWMAAREGVLVV